MLAVSAVVLSGFADEASVFGGGGLRLLSREVSFSPNAVYPGWKGSATHSRELVTNEAGLATFTLDMAKLGGRFDGTLRTKVRGDGCLAARWTMIPSTNMWVEECCVHANFDVGIYGGGKVRIDGKDLTGASCVLRRRGRGVCGTDAPAVPRGARLHGAHVQPERRYAATGV